MITDKTDWTKSEVAKVLGISPRTVQFYTDQGIIVPGVYAPQGRGTTRKYSATNLVEYAVVSELSRCGLALADIKQVMRSGRLIESGGGDPWDPLGLPTNQHFYIIIYDPHSQDGMLVMTGAKGHDLSLNFAPDAFSKRAKLNKGPYTSAVVVDITSITERIRSLI